MNKKPWAKIYADLSEESRKAIKYLRKEGFPVLAIPVDGKFGPELRIGLDSYYGLKEIKAFAKRFAREE